MEPLRDSWRGFGERRRWGEDLGVEFTLDHEFLLGLQHLDGIKLASLPLDLVDLGFFTF